MEALGLAENCRAIVGPIDELIERHSLRPRADVRVAKSGEINDHFEERHQRASIRPIPKLAQYPTVSELAVKIHAVAIGNCVCFGFWLGILHLIVSKWCRQFRYFASMGLNGFIDGCKNGCKKGRC